MLCVTTDRCLLLESVWWTFAHPQLWQFPPPTCGHLSWPLGLLVGFLNTFFFFLPDLTACKILVPWPGIKPSLPAVDAQSPNHWTTREASLIQCLNITFHYGYYKILAVIPKLHSTFLWLLCLNSIILHLDKAELQRKPCYGAQSLNFTWWETQWGQPIWSWPSRTCILNGNWEDHGTHTIRMLPLEKKMATHSSILAWEIPRTEEPGGLQPLGLQRRRHDWVTNTLFSLSGKA